MQADNKHKLSPFATAGDVATAGVDLAKRTVHGLRLDSSSSDKIHNTPLRKASHQTQKSRLGPAGTTAAAPSQLAAATYAAGHPKKGSTFRNSYKDAAGYSLPSSISGAGVDTDAEVAVGAAGDAPALVSGSMRLQRSVTIADCHSQYCVLL